MRSDAVLPWMGLCFSAALGIVGCGSEDPIAAPQFPDDTGQAAFAPSYPEGPFGIQEGSVIRNYQFIGFVNAMEFSEGLQPIALSDFYNPTGDETFPEGSPYGAGKAKPKALLINVGSVWCPPCNAEADEMLPGKYREYKPRGGEFLMQLADGRDPSIPANSVDLGRWTTKYKVDYPATIDPTYKLGALFTADAFPANMIIKTADMTIVRVIAGTPDPDPTQPPDFWATFEDVLDSKP
jgi:hypothetical protein